MQEEGPCPDENKEMKYSDESVAEFRQQLYDLRDVYMNNAFGMAHRARISITMVGFTCEKRASGALLAKELNYFSKAMAYGES